MEELLVSGAPHAGGNVLHLHFLETSFTGKSSSLAFQGAWHSRGGLTVAAEL